MSTSLQSPDHRHELGKRGEQFAESYYIQLGYRCLARNWRHGRAEIDRIMVRDNVLVLLEVKTRSEHGFEPPAQPRQWRRIAHAGMRYAQQQGWDGELRLDLALVSQKKGNNPQIRMILNIWEGWG